MATRKTAEQPCRQERAIALRFVQHIKDARHDLQGGIEAQRVHMVVGLQKLRHLLGIHRLVE